MVRVTTCPACFIKYSQQAEFARLQLDFLAVAGELMGQTVQLQAIDAIECLLAGPRPLAPCKNLDAGEKLREGIRFGEIVVASRAQALTRSSTCPSAERISAGVSIFLRAEGRQ